MVSKLVRSRLSSSAVAAAARLWNVTVATSRDASVAVDVAVRTGYAETIVEYRVRPPLYASLAATIRSRHCCELGSLKSSSEFVAREGRPGECARCRWAGVCVVSSRTTIGVAVVPAIFALCAGCEVLVKDREDRLVSAFFETICEMLPELRDRASPQCLERRTGDAYAIYGTFDAWSHSATTRRSRKSRTALSWRTRFIRYGNAASAGYVARAALERRR